MNLFYKILLAVSCCILSAVGTSQVVISGTVYDSTKAVPVNGVIVRSTGGMIAITDSNGKYSIPATISDSLVFIYQNKPTAKFSVSAIPNTGILDIALHVRIHEKYIRLKEVKVYAKSYQQDSIAYRERYAKIFNYQRPGVRLSSNAYSGAVGADLDELINIFRFKRNKQLKKMQQRLESEEREKFIDYRFSKTTVRRVTRLEGRELDEFMKLYRPQFDFTANSSMVEFYQYILDASYEYQSNKEKEKYVDSRFNKELVHLATGLTGTDLDLFMKRYRPGYHFTLNSNAAQFHEYIMAAYQQFKIAEPGKRSSGDGQASPANNQ